ncbi:PREDICTED: cytochrome P450 2D6-like [Thamnophis sirtalis]|uniref:Cytochrome P450 2D6-like n=1 Tax=Thamnophis sirtalis TaxID=35019 RepID=A0A6I9YPU7_9SAUR|nr:PREDICTED: cytochrome P450 2D6-like [Thamnophis sirtalis]
MQVQQLLRLNRVASLQVIASNQSPDASRSGVADPNSKLIPVISFQLAQKYGPVFSLYIGGTFAVFTHGFSAAKEVLVTKGIEFAGRADNPIVDDILKKKGIILAPYGPAWKEQRRFSLMLLRNFGLGKKSMQEKILQEATCLIEAFAENSDSPLDPRPFLETAVTNIMSSILFGKRFENDDNVLRTVMDVSHQNLKMMTGPWAMVPLIGGQENGHDSQNAKNCAEQKGSSFEEEQLLILLMDLLTAGSETTSVSLQWAMLYLVAFPDIQEKCQKEIDAFLGSSSNLKYEDREKLPYTNAVIHEIQRCTTVVPLGVAHTPIQNAQLGGYQIPKVKLGIFTGLWFSGPRVCLGENLARMELFLFLTSILRNFQLSWPDKSQAPNFTPNLGVTLFPSSFKISVKGRQESD